METDLLDDLLEDSERVMHGCIARFQVEQQRRYEGVLAATEEWNKTEALKPGSNPEQLAWMRDEHVKNVRRQLKACTYQFVDAMERERETRDGAILDYVSLIGSEASPSPKQAQ